MVAISVIAYTAYIALLLVIILSIIAIPLLICICFTQKFLVSNPLFKLIERFFYWVAIKGSFIPISYQGLQNIPSNPCIVVANHQSSFDIPVIGYALGKRPHIWLAWSALGNGPLLRFILKRVAVLVDPSSPTKAARSLIEVINTIKKHPWDLVIFPEGGRYTDGNINKFFNGFAIIAHKTNRPVLPIKIIGLNTVYPPHSWWIYRKPVTVIIGKPIFMQEDETNDQFATRISQWYLQKSYED